MHKIQVGDVTVTIDGPTSSLACEQSDLAYPQGLLVRLAEAVTGVRNAYRDVSLRMSFDKTVELANEGRLARVRGEGYQKLCTDYAELRALLPLAQTHQGALDALVEAKAVVRQYSQIRSEFRRLLNNPALTHGEMMRLLTDELPPAVRKVAREAKAKKNKRKR